MSTYFVTMEETEISLVEKELNVVSYSGRNCNFSCDLLFRDFVNGDLFTCRICKRFDTFTLNTKKEKEYYINNLKIRVDIHSDSDCKLLRSKYCMETY